MSIKTEQYIAKAIKVHGDRYDYSKVEYVNAKSKITIVCKEHGDFLQTPCNHLSNYNCQKCAKNLKMTTESFIVKAKEVHGETYDYSKVDYINADTKIVIVCREHDDFVQIPDFHINRKTGCPKCANNVCDTATFIERAIKKHGETYTYTNVVYSNNRSPVSITCKKHGDFLQIPYVHVYQGCGCPHCINKTEFKLLTMLKTVYPTVQHQFKADWCKRKQCLPFDFVIDDKKIIIELDGDQHRVQVANWVAPHIQQEIDAYKTKCANDNGYKVIRVSTQDVNDELLLQIQNTIDNYYCTGTRLINDSFVGQSTSTEST